MCGDTTLGGVDFVRRLMDYCQYEYREKNNENIIDDYKALEKLRVQC
jgi:molecular chaperone DnaK (HSP70)